MESILLSICIPSINRCQLLIRALQSISDCQQKKLIQICISNNHSDEDYSSVLKTCYLLREKGFNIDYISHPSRLSLDENMLFVTKMAKGDYLYYLGDDDYFLPNGVDSLISFIQDKSPSLAILKGAEGENLSKLDSVKQFLSAEEGYRFLYDKLTFGTILISKNLINESGFVQLMNTSHAYASFLIKLFNEKEQGSRIFYIESPIVRLGVDIKTYSKYFLEVTFQHIPHWFDEMAKLSHSNIFLEVKKRHLLKMMTPQRLIFFKGQRLPINLIPKLIKTNSSVVKIYIKIIDLIPNFVCNFAYTQYMKLKRG